MNNIFYNYFSHIGLFDLIIIFLGIIVVIYQYFVVSNYKSSVGKEGGGANKDLYVRRSKFMDEVRQEYINEFSNSNIKVSDSGLFVRVFIEDNNGIMKEIGKKDFPESLSLKLNTNRIDYEVALTRITNLMEILPSLGLLGTVLSFLNTLFSMKGGISISGIIPKFAPALTTTASGLIVLIINIVMYVVFTSIVKPTETIKKEENSEDST